MKNLKLRKIFVYGTLQRGLSNSSYIESNEIEWMESAIAEGEIYMVKNARYPAATFQDNCNSTITGELYSIKPECIEYVIQKCDHLEGHPSYYKRKEIEVVDSYGETHAAYSYEFKYLSQIGERINSGSYKDEMNGIVSERSK